MKIRWGLIGAGDIANKRVATAIQSDPSSELVAVCRRSEVPLNQFADQFSIPGRFTDADDLIASSDVDAVYIATPVDCHLPQTVAAARSKKHVLVEKPMAIDPNQCAEMIAVCDQAGVKLGVAYYRRFYPVVEQISNAIESGSLGRILSITCVCGNPNRFPADDWRVIRSRGGGGPLMDIGSHRIDLFLRWLGEPKRVQAMMSDSPDYEAEQTATVTMGFTGGAQAILQCYFGTVDTPDRVEVIGTDGRIIVEELNQGDLSFWNAEGHAGQSYPPSDNLHGPLIHDFSAAVMGNRSPAVDGRIGKQTNDIIEKAYKSAASH